MSRYRTLLTQYDQLKFEIEREMRAESERLATVVAARVREVLEEFGFDIDVVPRNRNFRKASKGKSVAPKYRDPKTGQTWSGRGRAPIWIAGKDREQYRIEAIVDERASRYAARDPDDRSSGTDTYPDRGRVKSDRSHSVESAASPDAASEAGESVPPQTNPIQPTHDD